MRTANTPGQHLPNPLASHTPANMDSAGPAASASAPSPRDARPSQDTTSSRPSSSAAAAAAAHLDVHSPTSTPRPSLSASNSHRPSLARAKSDFGPRQPQQPQQPHDPTEDSSVDGHFKIRHGWDDQLNSEEYSNMLTSVCCLELAAVPASLTSATELLHVLYRQETRVGRTSKG